MKTRSLFAALSALLLVTSYGCSPKSETAAPGDAAPKQESKSVAETPIADTLKLTIVPYEAAEKLSEEYTPMAAYLARKLGKKEGKFVSVLDYAGVMAALQSGQVDVAYLSPFPYALATGKIPLAPLAMPWVKGSLTYKGIIFVKADSPVKTLADLKGKSFAFGDSTSTTGYLLPRALLEKEGVYSTLKWRNAGNANVVVNAVESGNADAGAAYDLVFQVAYRDNPEKAKGMRKIAETESIPNGIYVARANLPAAELQKLKDAFMEMNTDPEGRVAMQKAPNDKIVAADDALFDRVREIARSQGIDISILDKKKK